MSIDPEHMYQSMAAALRRANDARARSDEQLAELKARFEQLVEILAVRGVVSDANRCMIDRVAQTAGAAGTPRVHLRMLVDKYEVVGAPIDCASLLHLCHGRCCSFRFELSVQDLDEGMIRWEIEDPYRIRQERDGYCSHLDRKTLGCTAYPHRPAPCRAFDCRDDHRVWLDFDKKIPAPMPDGVLPPPGSPGT